MTTHTAPPRPVEVFGAEVRHLLEGGRAGRLVHPPEEVALACSADQASEHRRPIVRAPAPPRALPSGATVTHHQHTDEFGTGIGTGRTHAPYGILPCGHPWTPAGFRPARAEV